MKLFVGDKGSEMGESYATYFFVLNGKVTVFGKAKGGFSFQTYILLILVHRGP